MLSCDMFRYVAEKERFPAHGSQGRLMGVAVGMVISHRVTGILGGRLWA